MLRMGFSNRNFCVPFGYGGKRGVWDTGYGCGIRGAGSVENAGPTVENAGSTVENAGKIRPIWVW